MHRLAGFLYLPTLQNNSHYSRRADVVQIFIAFWPNDFFVPTSLSLLGTALASTTGELS